MNGDAWATPEQIDAAKARLRARMPGWQDPAAFGVALVAPSAVGSAEVSFPVVNNPVHGLPALVLGLITGRRGGSATIELTPSELDAAITLLAPAAAATMYNHPNLASWRALRTAWEAEPDARLFAVFIGELADEATSPYERSLRGQLARGEMSAPIWVGERQGA